MERQKTLNEMAEEYGELLNDKDAINDRINGLRDLIKFRLSEVNRDSYGIAEHHSPVIITFKMEKTAERMKKGGKDRLREMITSLQWSEIYNPPGEKPTLRVQRKKE